MTNSNENYNESITQKVFDRIFESPIDINVINTERIELPELVWNNYEKMPNNIKLINSGETLILLPEWSEHTPYIQSGPLQAEYVFSRIHFHWGSSVVNGSEHTVDSIRMPMEMHAIHFKKTYRKLELAKNYKDGLVFLVYLFEMKSNHNPVLNRIVSKLPNIQECDTNVTLPPFVIEELVQTFQSDYYLYNGLIENSPIATPVLWFITRKATAVSPEQLLLFRQLLKENTAPINNNCRKAKQFEHQIIFYVNPPYRFVNSTLSPIPILYKDEE